MCVCVCVCVCVFIVSQDERIRSSGLLASASLQPILLNGDAGGAGGEGKSGGAGGMGGGGLPALEPMPVVKGEGAGEALLGEYQRLATFRERLLEEVCNLGCFLCTWGRYFRLSFVARCGTI